MILNDEQIDSLMPIANQGSTTGGNAAFDARNMLGIEVHDSSSMRMAHFEVPQGIAVSHIYPNPATGQISINVDLPESQDAVLDIFDLAGRRVTAWTLIGGQKTYSFDASFLPAGTYIYRIISQGEMIYSDRLVMIKEE